MAIKKFNQTRTYVDLSPELFSQIEEASKRFKIPRTTLLRRLISYSFLNHLETVLNQGQPHIWKNPIKDIKA